MKLKEMQSCADETLAFFIQTMPGVPFGVDDIEIHFAAKKDMVECFKTLCGEYSPERLVTFTDGHFDILENQLFGNAIIGRGKSAVVVRTDYRIERDNLRRIVFHELMHIYCGKTEMDCEHFIDIYGSGHTPDPDPDDKEYDGYVTAGYSVWSEFIAEYYAVLKTAPERHYGSDVVEYVFELLGEIHVASGERKTAFAMMSAYLLSCVDVEKMLEGAKDISDGSPEGIAAAQALQDCLIYLHEQMQNANPCKITEAFICELGQKHLMFALKNSVYMGVL